MQQKSIDTSFRVDPGELDTFVEGVRRLEAAMARHVQTFESLELDSSAFGRLPSISDKLNDSYQRHVSEGTKAFAEGKAVLRSAANRGAESAAGYRTVERANLAEIEELGSMINPRRRVAVESRPAPEAQ